MSWRLRGSALPRKRTSRAEYECLLFQRAVASASEPLTDAMLPMRWAQKKAGVLPNSMDWIHVSNVRLEVENGRYALAAKRPRRPPLEEIGNVGSGCRCRAFPNRGYSALAARSASKTAIILD